MMNIEELSTYELIETIRACQNEIEKRKAEERNSAIETFKQAWITLENEYDIDILGPDGCYLFFEDLKFC